MCMVNMKSRKNSLILLALLCLPGAARALSTDREQPIYIEAEHVKIDKLKGFSRYEGNVKFVQGSLVIRGGSVLLYHKDGSVNKAIIRGQPASFQQEPDEGGLVIVSQARKIEYFAKDARLYLFDSAKVTQGKNSFSGEKIEYDIVKGTVIANKGARKGSRINAIIEPSEETNITP